MALSRDPCNFLQYGLKKLILFTFDNLLYHIQKRLYLQREIKPFELILQVFGHISAQCQYGRDEAAMRHLSVSHR